MRTHQGTGQSNGRSTRATGALRAGLAAAALVVICGAQASALENGGPDGVLRINYCGTFDRQWFLDYRDPQWGDTLTDQLRRAATAKCEQLGLSYPPGHAFSGGDALGVFNTGLNHNDPYNSGGITSFDGYDPFHAVNYQLTGASFACIESVTGSVTTVPVSMSCPPFSDDYPGGSASLPDVPSGIDVFQQANGAFLSANTDNGIVTVGEILGIHGIALLELGLPVGGEGVRPLQLAHEKFEQALRHDPWNTKLLKLSATALIRIAQRTKEGLDGPTVKSAVRRLMIAEDVQRGAAAYDLGCVAALRGDAKAARRWLDLAAHTKQLPASSHIQRDPDLDGVRGEKWFDAIVKAAAKAERKAARAK